MRYRTYIWKTASSKPETRPRKFMVKQRRPRKKLVREPIIDNRKWVVFDWAVVIIFAIVFLVGVISALVQPGRRDEVQQKFPIPGSSIVVQVFNGSGNINAAVEITDSLRKYGIDVRGVVKNAKNIYPYTLLLNRKGDESKCDSLAKILGLPDDRIIIQRNNDIFDVTLVLGKDFKNALAKLMKNPTGR